MGAHVQELGVSDHCDRTGAKQLCLLERADILERCGYNLSDIIMGEEAPFASSNAVFVIENHPALVLTANRKHKTLARRMKQVARQFLGNSAA